MFALVVHEVGRSPWRKAYATREIKIGSASDNDLVLDAQRRVSGRHARIVLKDGHYILVDLKSGSGTFVNGRKLTSPVVVKETDVIAVGDIRVEIVTLAYEELSREPLVARDPMERELVDLIGHGDEASRAVYADWLEGNGDPDVAELIRIQQALDEEIDAAAIDAGTARMRQLAASIELPLRARLSKAAIENCVPQFKFKCPKQWSALRLTAVEGERHCGQCERTVYFCATIDEARTRGGDGQCVAIDVASPRWIGDLDPPFDERMCTACDLDVGAGLRECPRCGARIEYEMMMGEIG